MTSRGKSVLGEAGGADVRVGAGGGGGSRATQVFDLGAGLRLDGGLVDADWLWRWQGQQQKQTAKGKGHEDEDEDEDEDEEKEDFYDEDEVTSQVYSSHGHSHDPELDHYQLAIETPPPLRPTATMHPSSSADAAAAAAAQQQQQQQQPGVLAQTLCFVLVSTQTHTLAVIETVVPPLAASAYGWHYQWGIGALFAAGAASTLVGALMLKLASRVYSFPFVLCQALAIGLAGDEEEAGATDGPKDYNFADKLGLNRDLLAPMGDADGEHGSAGGGGGSRATQVFDLGAGLRLDGGLVDADWLWRWQGQQQKQTAKGKGHEDEDEDEDEDEEKEDFYDEDEVTSQVYSSHGHSHDPELDHYQLAIETPPPLRPTATMHPSSSADAAAAAAAQQQQQQQQPGVLAQTLCFVLVSTQTHTLAVIETVVPPLAASAYGWHYQWGIGALFAAGAASTLVGALMLKLASRVYSFPFVLCQALAIGLAGSLLMVDWAPLKASEQQPVAPELFFVGFSLLALAFAVSRNVMLGMVAMMMGPNMNNTNTNINADGVARQGAGATASVPLPLTYTHADTGFSTGAGAGAGVSTSVGTGISIGAREHTDRHHDDGHDSHDHGGSSGSSSGSSSGGSSSGGGSSGGSGGGSIAGSDAGGSDAVDGGHWHWSFLPGARPRFEFICLAALFSGSLCVCLWCSQALRPHPYQLELQEACQTAATPNISARKRRDLSSHTGGRGRGVGGGGVHVGMGMGLRALDPHRHRPTEASTVRVSGPDDPTPPPSPLPSSLPSSSSLLSPGGGGGGGVGGLASMAVGTLKQVAGWALGSGGAAGPSSSADAAGRGNYGSGSGGGGGGGGGSMPYQMAVIGDQYRYGGEDEGGDGHGNEHGGRTSVGSTNSGTSQSSGGASMSTVENEREYHAGGYGGGDGETTEEEGCTEGEEDCDTEDEGGRYHYRHSRQRQRQGQGQAKAAGAQRGGGHAHAGTQGRAAEANRVRGLAGNMVPSIRKRARVPLPTPEANVILPALDLSQWLLWAERLPHGVGAQVWLWHPQMPVRPPFACFEFPAPSFLVSPRAEYRY
eukprot:g412.t1